MKDTGLRAWVAYIGIRAVFAVMQCFPIEWNLRTARIIARIWPRIMPRHRQRALAHLAAAFRAQQVSGVELKGGEAGTRRDRDRGLRPDCAFAASARPREAGRAGSDFEAQAVALTPDPSPKGRGEQPASFMPQPARYSMAELGRMADRCLESVTMFAVEAICLPRLITPFTWSRYIRLVNFEETLRLMLEGRGLVMVTGHYGSFELIGHLLAALRFRVAAVMRPLDNVYLNRFIVASRRTHGLMLLDKFGATNQAEQLLKEGVLLGFIGDQDAGRKGMFVEFFGQPASTYKSIGLLAMSANVPVVVGYARRQGNAARYDVGVQRVIYPHEWEQQADPLRWITQEYTRAIEQTVRDGPEQYLWIHRRWKSKPKAKRRETGHEVWVGEGQYTGGGEEGSRDQAIEGSR